MSGNAENTGSTDPTVTETAVETGAKSDGLSPEERSELNRRLGLGVPAPGNADQLQGGTKSVLLVWADTGRHDIQVSGITNPREMRALLEHGLRHIRRCIFRGRPLTTSPAEFHRSRGMDLQPGEEN
jgi:hypothetical protein